MATLEEATEILTTYRGKPQQGVVRAHLTDTVFGDSVTVYMAREDVEHWSYTEFIFVVDEKPDVFTGNNTKWWAETQHFELPVILTSHS